MLRLVVYLASITPSWLYPLILDTNQADVYAAAWPGAYSRYTHASLSSDVVRLPEPLNWDTRYGGAIHVRMNKSTADNIINGHGYQHVTLDQEVAIRHIPEPAARAFGSGTELFVIDDHVGEVSTLIINPEHTEAIFRVEDVQNPVGDDDDRKK